MMVGLGALVSDRVSKLAINTKFLNMSIGIMDSWVGWGGVGGVSAVPHVLNYSVVQAGWSCVEIRR